MRFAKNLVGFAVRLKRLIPALTLIVVLCAQSCASRKPVAPSVPLPDPVTVDRLIPVYIESDSALLQMLFECDSNRTVIMKSLKEEKSKNMQSDIQFNDGKLDYKASTKPDTVFVQGKDSIIYRPQIVEKEVNHLTWWQELWIKLGKGLSCLAILLISPKLWKYGKMIIKLF